MNKIIRFLLTIAVSSALFACSSTSEVPEGDRLYTGLEPIKYTTMRATNTLLPLKRK